MRTPPPPLLPIFRSRGQARLLARVFLSHRENVPLSRLADEIGVAKSRVSEEVDRLEAAGLVASDRVGTARLVRANEQSPFYPELHGLLLKAFGPIAVLERQLTRVDGIDEAFVYGSWAARYLGDAGTEPADVDLLVIGEPDVRSVRRAARAAERELGRQVNATVLSQSEWADAERGFVRTVQSRPLVRLRINDDD